MKRLVLAVVLSAYACRRDPPPPPPEAPLPAPVAAPAPPPPPPPSPQVVDAALAATTDASSLTATD